MNPRQMWEAELAAGVNGQQRERTGTWTMDALYTAACWWCAADDSDAEGFATIAATQRDRAWRVLAGEVFGEDEDHPAVPRAA